MTKDLITNEQSLIGASYQPSGYAIPVYDDRFGSLWIMRDSLGVRGICRAQTWEDAYNIAEDEFFPEADETIEELVKEYGFRREHRKVIRSLVNEPEETRHPQLGAFEKFAEDSDYTDNGKLPLEKFIRWETIETPDSDAVFDNDLFQEAYGFRPNGPNSRDKLKHGIYAKDLNGERLDLLTPEMLTDLGIELQIESD